MPSKCESKKANGKPCRNNALKNQTCCGVHKKPRKSGNFLGRMSTLMRELALDLVNCLPRTNTIEADPDVCYYCKKFLTSNSKTEDHVMNLVKESRINRLSNFSNVTVPCCRSCNSRYAKDTTKRDTFFNISDESIVYYDIDKKDEDELYETLSQIKTLMTKAQTIVNNYSFKKFTIETRNADLCKDSHRQDDHTRGRIE